MQKAATTFFLQAVADATDGDHMAVMKIEDGQLLPRDCRTRFPTRQHFGHEREPHRASERQAMTIPSPAGSRDIKIECHVGFCKFADRGRLEQAGGPNGIPSGQARVVGRCRNCRGSDSSRLDGRLVRWGRDNAASNEVINHTGWWCRRRSAPAKAASWADWPGRYRHYIIDPFGTFSPGRLPRADLAEHTRQVRGL